MTSTAAQLTNKQTVQLAWKKRVLKAALQLVPADDVCIVETGTIRQRPGFSTLFFAQMIRDVWKGQGKLISIDMNKAHILLSMQILEESRLAQFVEWKHGESTEWITTLEAPIDVLYLDASWYPPSVLAEFQAAEDHMHKHTIIAVDDCERGRGGTQGKGTEVVPYAKSRGWNVRMVNGPEKCMAVMRRREVC